MPPGAVEEISVRSSSDVQTARRVIRAFALNAGMAPSSIEELVIATSELGSNLVKYSSVGGLLSYYIRYGDDASPIVTLELQASDSGPGIGDLALALTDGYSSNGTMGSGLPAVQRFADTFSIESGPSGTTIRFSKRITPG